jgi:hypothetical protein
MAGNPIAAQTRIQGIVKDGATGTPLSLASVGFLHTDAGALTDDGGRFSLETTLGRADSIRVSMIGYKEVVLPVKRSEQQPWVILLEEQGATLNEITVKASNSERYRNKDNPAVALIRKAIEHKESNYPSDKPHASYRQYERLQVSLMRNQDSSRNEKGSWSAYIRQHADTQRLKGKALLPIFVHEKASRFAYDAVRKQQAEQVIGEKKTDLEDMADASGLDAYFEKIYAGTDVYDNNILLGDQQLLSPIAGMAPAFYKYFITDTLKDSLPWQVQLSFFPRNQADLLFKGTLQIALDSSFAVTHAYMTVNKNINLNWVDDLDITLQYRKSDAGTYYLQQSTLGMAMSALSKTKGIFGERFISVTDYQVTSGDSPLPVLPATGKMPELQEEEWAKLRPQSLNTAQGDAFANLDTLKNRPSFKRALNIFTLLLSGYEVLGPLEIGPVNSFYSFNPVEGFRLKLGGRTTDQFSTRFVLEGHLVYGFRDKQWKYNAGITYSLTGRSIFRFPVRALTLRHSYETQIPGQDLAFMEEDNFLLSFKRGDNSKWVYSKKWSIEYLHETKAHLSFRLGFTHSIQSPSGSLVYQAAAPEPRICLTNITLSEFNGEIRWAPREQFYQGKKFRRPVFNAYPIFTLRGTIGIEGLLNAKYSYQAVTLNIFKRFYLSQIGFSDVVLEGGKVFGHVPFPLLYIHKANQTYAYQLQSYNLMNFMEFVSDRYVSLHIDHSFNGFFLNKIPLVRKLQLRETASFKALYGDVSRDNRPGEGRSGLFDFPANNLGRPVTHSLKDGPYLEASLGISNLFRILRVDLVKRFTYLDHPGISEWGVRARIVLAL